MMARGLSRRLYLAVVSALAFRGVCLCGGARKVYFPARIHNKV